VTPASEPSLRPNGSPISVQHSFHSTPPAVLDIGHALEPSPFNSGGDEDEQANFGPSAQDLENLRAELNDMDLDSVKDYSDHSSNRSLRDLQSTIRRARSDEYKRFHNPPKARSKASVDKMRWDGLRLSYTGFASEVEGTLLMLGMSYLLMPDVHKGYNSEGIDYFKSESFWTTYKIGYLQVDYDLKYLYGCCKLQLGGEQTLIW